jgi:hypothetical protein
MIPDFPAPVLISIDYREDRVWAEGRRFNSVGVLRVPFCSIPAGRPFRPVPFAGEALMARGRAGQETSRVAVSHRGRRAVSRGADLPGEHVHDGIRRFSSLDIRFHLITPAEFEELAERYLN